MKVIIFILVTTIYSYIAIGDDKHDVEIASLAKEFRITENTTFDEFKKSPSRACFFLINELKVVSDTHVSRDNKANNNTMHIIDCIRALRALTGQKFYAQTEYKFDEIKEKDRIYWLFLEYKDKIPFFSNWMSRDSEFIAPEDAQRRIIEQWEKWYEKNKDKEIHGNDNINFWYF